MKVQQYTLTYYTNRVPASLMTRYSCTLRFASSDKPFRIEQSYDEDMEEKYMDEHFSALVLGEFLPILKEKLPTQFQAIVGTLAGRIVREGEPGLDAILIQASFRSYDYWRLP
ncbi:MAG: hypothetical protein QQN63_08910 [Nitrosopumilus sp.]